MSQIQHDAHALTEIAATMSQSSASLEDRRGLAETLRAIAERMEVRERQTRHWVDASLDAFVTADAEGRVIEWNRRAEEIFGRSSQQAMGRSLDELIAPPRYRDMLRHALERMQNAETLPTGLRQFELKALDGGGVEFPILASIFVTENEAGGPRLAHAFLRDMSRKKRTEAALRHSESLFHSLIKNLPIYVIRKDREGRLTFANHLFCELLGSPLDALMGKTDHDLFPKELADKYRADDLAVFRTGQPFAGIEVNRAGETKRHFEVRKTGIRDERGEIVEVQATFWDVTEREETRAALGSRERLAANPDE